MFNCFLCKANLASLQLLQHHVRKHDVFSISVFKCSQGDCRRSFNTIKSIIQHIRKAHTGTPNSTCAIEQSHSNDNAVAESYVDRSEDIDSYVSDNEIELPSFDVRDLSFILSFYANVNFNRTNVENIIRNTKLWADYRFEGSNSFHNLDSEYKIQKALVSQNLWINPKSFVFDYNEAVTRKGSTQCLKMQPFTCSVIPLKCTLEKRFSIPHVLNLAELYMARRNILLKDVKDGRVCEDLPQNCFPYIVFFDEVETGNPLNSHKGKKKVGVYYFSLRCFPPHLYGKLSSIFLYAVVPSSAMEYRYISPLLTQLAREASDLWSEGIIINDKRYTFKFIGLTGDNLGQHQILGFSGSFSANYCCRVCRACKNVCRISCQEDVALLRNRVNYAEDVTLNDASSTGVKFECPLNSIPEFHVTENIVFDIMHDILEGIANFGMCAILKTLTDNKIITVQNLNDRIHMFPFLSSANRPHAVSLRRIHNDDLGYSAAEMMNLVLYFSLIIGDIIPEDSEVWYYYLTLREILDILLLKELSVSVITYLDVLITEHHHMYQNLFQKHLKPKHHHLLHYKRCLLNVGPLSHLWAMRFESKNFQTKMFSQVIQSSINICKSLSIRHMYLLAYNLLQWRKLSSFDGIEETGPTYSCDSVTGLCYRWVVYHGVRYSVDSIVQVLNLDDTINPHFGRIRYIQIDSDKIYFILCKYCHVTFSYHLACYIVDTLSSNLHICCICEDISKPLVYIVRNEHTYVSSASL